MKSDALVRHDVEAELQWDPSVDATKIAVIVHDNIVTLTGESAHLAGRWAAEDAVKRVKGVRAIANEIQVRIPLAGVRSDTEIAEAAANALRWNVITGASAITPVVKEGHITLSGHVQWGFQRNAAESAVRHLLGVKDVSNEINVTSALKASDVKERIENAFRRNANLDAHNIEVRVNSSTVTLEGHVRTWQEREDAGIAAWAAPGVGMVENQIRLQ